MPLQPGSRLGPYELLAPIGAGGMGEVWRARDTKLGREVALKILPEAVASDPERLARFEREAQLLASLNHPNIAAIYGLEEADGAPLPRAGAGRGRGPRGSGSTRGPLPLDEALDDRPPDRRGARGGARERHRPPRPEARATSSSRRTARSRCSTSAWPRRGRESSRRARARPPTCRSRRRSRAPAPRPASSSARPPTWRPSRRAGKQVDKRSDVWAFGALLYEMLTGRRLFDGETVSDTLAAVLRGSRSGRRCPPARRRAYDACSSAASSATRSCACATSARRASRS